MHHVTTNYLIFNMQNSTTTHGNSLVCNHTLRI